MTIWFRARKKKTSKKTARLLFARRMKERRLTQNMSQEDLAAESGLHRTYIGSVERGERNIAVDNMEKIAEALSCGIADLLV